MIMSERKIDKKKEYIKPTVEVIIVDEKDIITDSNPIFSGNDNDPEGKEEP